MKIKKVLMCAAILTACAGGIYLVTLWNSMSVDFDQFEEDEDEEPSVSELSFDEQKEVCLYVVMRIRIALKKQKKPKCQTATGLIH